MAGVVAGSRELVAAARAHQVEVDSVLDPFPAFLVRRGLKTLALRLERAGENALGGGPLSGGPPAGHASSSPASRLPQHELARRQLDGFGGMLAFELEGGREAGERFMDALELCGRATSLGGSRRVLHHPASTSPSPVLAGAARSRRRQPGLLRLSVGCEDAGDIVADLDQALAQA